MGHILCITTTQTEPKRSRLFIMYFQCQIARWSFYYYLMQSIVSIQQNEDFFHLSRLRQAYEIHLVGRLDLVTTFINKQETVRRQK